MSPPEAQTDEGNPATGSKMQEAQRGVTAEELRCRDTTIPASPSALPHPPGGGALWRRGRGLLLSARRFRSRGGRERCGASASRAAREHHGCGRVDAYGEPGGTRREPCAARGAGAAGARV